MQSLRRARFLVRLVLAWFVLSLGVAIAAPIVQPQGMELICSAGGGAKLLLKSDQSPDSTRGHTLDCPLCLMGSALPPLPSDPTPPQAPRPLAQALPALPDAPIAGHTAAPPPSRGPPFFA